jgi:hypothetical protein
MTPGGTLVWQYQNDFFTPAPTFVAQGFEIRPERLFRVERYPANFPALKGRTLNPAAPRTKDYSY